MDKKTTRNLLIHNCLLLRSVCALPFLTCKARLEGKIDHNLVNQQCQHGASRGSGGHVRQALAKSLPDFPRTEAAFHRVLEFLDVTGLLPQVVLNLARMLQVISDY